MKKLIAIILTMVLILGSTACDENDTQSETGVNDSENESPKAEQNNKSNKSNKLEFDNLKKPLGEMEIASVVPKEILSYSLDGETKTRTVISVTIERRQTNDKEDIVDTIVEMESDSVRKTSFCKFTINFYDVGGWMIDEWESYKEAVFYPLKPPSIEIVNETVSNKFRAENNFSFNLISEDTSNFESGKTSHTFEIIDGITKVDFYNGVSGNVIAVSEFSESSGSWRTYLDENIIENWNIDGIWSGSTSNNWGTMNVRIDISEVNDTSFRASGTLSRTTINGLYEFDVSFDEIFDYDNINPLFFRSMRFKITFNGVLSDDTCIIVFNAITGIVSIEGNSGSAGFMNVPFGEGELYRN